MTIGTRSYDLGSTQPLELGDDNFSELDVEGPAPLPKVWNFVCVERTRTSDLSAERRLGLSIADVFNARDD